MFTVKDVETLGGGTSAVANGGATQVGSITCNQGVTVGKLPWCAVRASDGARASGETWFVASVVNQGDPVALLTNPGVGYLPTRDSIFSAADGTQLLGANGDPVTSCPVGIGTSSDSATQDLPIMCFTDSSDPWDVTVGVCLRRG